MADEGNDFWFVAGPDGALRTVERRELVMSLSNGGISGKSLVWRQGWGNWLRAGQVAELAASVPAGARGPVVAPKLDPDMTMPPPVPGQDRAPIVPVDSNPNNDKPGTQLLIEVELGAQDLQAVKHPEPAKRTPPPPAPSRRLGVGAAPIIPVDSSPDNDKPTTGVIDDAEIVFEEGKEKQAPPPGNWVEVAAPQPLLKSEPTVPVVTKPEPIVPVDSAPHHEPVTGSLDDAEIEIVQAAAAAPATEPATSSPSLDSLARAVEAKRPPRPAPAVVIQPSDEPTSEGPTQLADAIIPVSDPDNEAPTQIHPAALKGDLAAPLPSWSEEVDAAMAQHQAARFPAAAPTPVPPAPQQVAYPSYAPAPKKSSALPLVLAGMGLLGLVGAVAVGGLLYFKPWESAVTPKAPTKPTAAATTSAPVAAPLTGTFRCTIDQSAKRLAPAIVVGVPPYVAPLSDSTIAVGIAESATSGTGLEVDLSTLEAKRVFTAPPGQKIVGVVPLGSAKGSFVVDREGGALGVPHTVDATPPFVLGFGPRGYTRQTKNGDLSDVWEGVSATEKATEARVAGVDKVGHIVTFRTGGQVRAGWVDSSGARKTDLTAIDAEGSRFGSPNVAVNDESALVTFAARKSDDSPWTVQLASAKHGLVPNKATTFELPSGGPGGDAIAPVAAGLGEGRWLLQWTEGPAGRRVVRTQVLDSSLKPVGEPLDVSAAGKEAGQGVVAVVGGRALSLQLVKGDTSYELWGTSLSCK